MKIKFEQSWGNGAYPQEYNSIKISNNYEENIGGEKGYLSFFYETLATRGYPNLGGKADIRYIYYNEFNTSEPAIWDVDVKEINKCIIKIFTKLDEIE